MEQNLKNDKYFNFSIYPQGKVNFSSLNCLPTGEADYLEEAQVTDQFKFLPASPTSLMSTTF